ncbi:cytochrome P450 [Hesseltinella vesiculosa]|uniref:Cytochrome P450 n=1 Tax=Hesseltinella vesiculosa TaxID=101127 RepID=A0A1X2GGC7_9FUNG|nr:cytochrome P450 [Hesseltinella vesiculosa]
MGWASLFSSLGAFVLTYVFSQLLSLYIWKDKNPDGTKKKPWAPSPQLSSRLYNGWEPFDVLGSKVFSNWAAECGAFLSVKIGQKRIHVLSSTEAVKLALVDKEQHNSAKLVQGSVEMAMSDNGQTVFAAPFDFKWQRVRRAVIAALNQTSPEWLTKFYSQQTEKLVEAIRQAKDNQGKVDSDQLRGLIDMVCLETSVILVMQQQQVDAEQIEKMLELMVQLEQEQQQPIYKASLYRVPGAPFVEALYKILWGEKAIRWRNRLLDSFVAWTAQVQEQEETDTPSTLPDGAPRFRHKLADIQPSKFDAAPEQFTKEQIIMNLMHLTLHSAKMLSTSLFTLIQRLATLPDWQVRARDNPELARAFVNECLRVSPPVPAYAHASRVDQEFEWNGQLYRIDNGDELVVNLHTIHNDEQLYPKASLFQPDRFLAQDAHKHYAFGVGRRHCQGAQVSEAFLEQSLLALVATFSLAGGDVEQRHHNSGIWSWLGRAETIGTSVAFKRRR